MFLRGIRGAITVDENSEASILDGTRVLLDAVMKENELQEEAIASIFFSVTSDLDAVFPAVAARKLGLMYTPLLCLNEIDVPGSLTQCVRILVHVNTDTPQSEIKNIYLRDAIKLRPDHST